MIKLKIKKNVCVVIPRNLPMPAIKGGAIETLLQDIIEENEVNYNCNLNIISIYNKKAAKQGRKYKHTNFIYYSDKESDNLKFFLFRAFRKLFNWQITYLEPYEQFVRHYVLNNNIDVFVNESADFNAFKKISKKIGKNNCYAHLHSQFPSNKRIDDTFGTIISVSDYIKNKWLQTSNINPENVKVLRNFADETLFSKKFSDTQKNSLRKKWGFTKSDFVLLFCGRIVPQKGVLELIKAVNSIQNKNIKLLIVGSPNFGDGSSSPYQKMVNKEVEKSHEKITFTGFVGHNELYKFYSISDCVVVPSTYEDPAPLVPIEAMMSGKALIVTNSGGIPEYVNNECAIIVNKEKDIGKQIREAILKIYKDPILKQSMEKASLQNSVNYTKEKYYYNYLKILKIL